MSSMYGLENISQKKISQKKISQKKISLRNEKGHQGRCSYCQEMMADKFLFLDKVMSFIGFERKRLSRPKPFSESHNEQTHSSSLYINKCKYLRQSIDAFYLIPD